MKKIFAIIFVLLIFVPAFSVAAVPYETVSQEVMRPKIKCVETRELLMTLEPAIVSTVAIREEIRGFPEDFENKEFQEVSFRFTTFESSIGTLYTSTKALGEYVCNDADGTRDFYQGISNLIIMANSLQHEHLKQLRSALD